MLPYNAPKDRGFTLIEMAVTSIVGGVLAAIAIPSFVGMYSRYMLDDALVQLKSHVQEAQKNAIKISKDCTVVLPSNGSDKIVVNSEESGTVKCVPTSLNFQNKSFYKDIRIRHNYSSPANKIQFNFKGETNTQGTIVLSLPNSNYQKCLVTSIGLGLFRTGDYDLSDTANATASNCTTKQQ